MPAYEKKKIPNEIVRIFDELEAARVRAEEYRHRNHKVIEEHERLCTEANAKLAAAKVVFIQNVDLLGGNYRSFRREKTRSVDIEKLLKLCPAADECCKREITLGALQEAIECGLIPETIAEAVIMESDKIKSPKSL